MSRAKETIDIEHLLVWAYRDQCVDRQAAGFRTAAPRQSSTSMLGQYMALGTKVDSSGYAASALGARVADDAMTVHEAVLSLSEMWIDWRGPNGVTIWDQATASGQGLLIEKRSGDWWLCVPPRAQRPGDALRRLEQACTVALVVVNAKSASRPDWHEGWEDEPESRRGGRGRGDMGCYRADEGRVMQDRALFGVWRACLALLAEILADGLDAFAPTGPQVAEQPWDCSVRVVYCVEEMENLSA